MNSLLRHAPCPACGRRHHFCLPADRLTPDREYRFLCPDKGQWAALRPGEPGEAVRYFPQGAVPLTVGPRP